MLKIIIKYKVKSISNWDIKIYEETKVYLFGILIKTKTNKLIE